MPSSSKEGAAVRAAARGQRAPRAYQRVASELLKEIGEGRWAVGDRLPTEAELCERFDVSRFTVRAALAQLERKEIVSRRPKVGTVVAARAARKRYAVSVGSLSELLAFLDSTVVNPIGVGEVVADRALAADLACASGAKWIRVQTLRTPAGGKVPISWTDYYLQPRFKPVVAQFGKKPGPVYPLLERRYGVGISSIEQDIGACSLPKLIAQRLSTRAGAPALRVIHRMVADEGEVLYCTVSLYPADRFRYVQALKRTE
jgi:DNA-binding GntR family transcriptional regulator